MGAIKPIKLNSNLIDKVMIELKTPHQKNMYSLMNYIWHNPKATLVQTSRYLDLPMSTIYDMKKKLRKILKEMK